MEPFRLAPIHAPLPGMSLLPRPTLLLAGWAYLHVIQYGMHVSILNGLQDALTCEVGGPELAASGWLTPCVPMTSAQFGLVTSVFTIGGLVGSLGSAAVTRRVGRVRVLQLSAMLVGIGSAIVSMANTWHVMVLGRIMVGLSAGLATVTVPLYLAELVPPLRGVLAIITQLCITSGVLLGQVLGFPFSEPMRWRHAFAISVLMAVVQIIGGFIAHQVGITDGLKGKRRRLQDGEDSPLMVDEHELPTLPPMHLKEILASEDRTLTAGVVVVMVTMVSQQLCGISPVMFFSTRVLEPVFKGSSKTIAVLIIIPKIPLTLLPAFLIKRFGTKKIILQTTLLMGLSSLCLAMGINQDAPALSITGMTTFVSAFSVGLGPLGWTTLSEVLPPHARTAAGSLAVGLNWTTQFIMGAAFLPLQEWLQTGPEDGEGNIFFVLAANCCLVYLGITLSYRLLERATRV